MRNLKNQLVQRIKHVKHRLRPAQLPGRVLYEHVPYFSQWESRELNKQILEKTFNTADDPNWKNSGAATKEEYVSWSWSGCGMACTKMLLAYRTGKVMPLVELGKKCAEYGGYEMPLEDSLGLLYKPYVTYVEKEFGWKARTVPGLILPEIMHELSRGNYVIASVNAQIRKPEFTPETKGGHLVLMLGYDTTKRELYFHNPSGESLQTQEYATVSFADFMKFFGGQGIIIQGDGPKPAAK